MRTFKILGLVILVGQSVLSFGQTQQQLTDDSNKKLKSAETELKTVYNKILETYKDDKEFIQAVKESQDSWTKFRTVELKMMYPDRAPGYYGSSHQMCVNEYLAELTKDRIKKLQTWLTGIEEGDVCGGTIKWKD